MRRAFLVSITAAILFLFALPSLDMSARTDGDSLAEDVAALKEFRQQQRDWNTWMDRRLSGDLSQSQGVQDARLVAMEEKISTIYGRQMVVYAFGSLGALILAVFAPLAWSSYVKRHDALMSRVNKVEKNCLMSGHEISYEDE